MDIITYGGGLQLNALFTALAAFTGTGDFMGAVRLMLLISIFVISVEIAFTGTLKPAPRLLIAVFVIYAALFSTADIDIIDRVEPANSTTVDNVPAGVAVVAHFASVTSDWFTEQFETSFSMPDDIRYRNNGLLFANRLVEASTEMEFGDQLYLRNMSEFMRSCVYYGANAGWFSWDDLMRSPDVWGYITGQGVGGAIFTSYDDGTGPSLVPCTTAMTELDNGWNAAIDATADVFGMRIFREPDVVVANAKLLSTLPLAYDYLGTISATGAEIVGQNVMINAMRRSFTSMAADANATAAIQDFAIGQAEAQQRTTYHTLGALAARTLPLIKNILEMLVYGLFPILLLFVIVSMFPGKTLIFYAKALVWLHLWPPLYAVLHFVMSVYSADAVTASATIPASVGGAGAGLAVMTQGGISAVNADMAAMAGYLAWMIPLLSWGIMNAGGFAISQLAAGIGSVAQSAGASAAGAASSGQINLGNTRLLNSTHFAANTAPAQNTGVGTVTDPMSGSVTTNTQGGHAFLNTAKHNVGLSANLSEGIQSSVSNRASASLSAANQDMKQFADTSASNFDNVMSFRQDASSSLSSSEGITRQFSASVNEKADAIQSGLQQISANHGLSMEDGLRAALIASAGGKIPFSEFGIRGEVARFGSAKNTALMNDLKQFAEQTNLGESWGQVLQSSENIAASRAGSIGDSDSHALSASLRNAVEARETASASLTEARAWESAASSLEQSGFAASFDAVAALKSTMVGQDKGFATPGNNSPTWTGGEVNRLFEAADRGDTQAIGILLNEAQRFGAAQGLDLAGVSVGVGDGAAANSFYDSSRNSISGGGAVQSQHAENTQDVLYNGARLDSELPGKEWAIKTDEINAKNAHETIRDATNAELDQVRSDLDEEGGSARNHQVSWRGANVPGAADDWIPSLGNN
ncbi:MAG: conjugal transfer protein TraG N-terminal domain-containing protein [Woeseia sp.]